jgi:hypothetical protein
MSSVWLLRLSPNINVPDLLIQQIIIVEMIDLPNNSWPWLSHGSVIAAAALLCHGL